MTEKLKIKVNLDYPIPEDCNDCIFNYDVITCKLYDRSIMSVGPKGDLSDESYYRYGEKPSFCNAVKMLVEVRR